MGVSDEIRIQHERTATARQALADVTRVVVVSKDGEFKEYWADSWGVSVQDAGRTVKVFARGDGAQAIAARSVELGSTLRLPAEAAQEYAQLVAEEEGQPDRFGPTGGELIEQNRREGKHDNHR